MLGTGIATRRPDAHVALPPDSVVLLYTDGLVETAGLPVEAGMERLRGHAAVLAGRPLPHFCDEILSRMRHDVVDDIALLALRVASG
jgi:serine phosphatase RsbU (regulator of sigma subunit)